LGAFAGLLEEKIFSVIGGVFDGEQDDKSISHGETNGQGHCGAIWVR
jgi:hypothetical protein